MIKRISRLAILMVFFNLLYFSSFPAWLSFEPQTITQPDGTIIYCYATGDEFHNWLHDEDGFTIIQNKQTGYYAYAELVGGELVASSHIVGQVDPLGAGLTPWINISGEQMKLKRAMFLKNQMPSKPQIEGYKSTGMANNTGTLNNLVVYIRFSDQPEFTQDTMFYYNMFNNDNAGYNSMLNYFHEVSYQQLMLPSWFYPLPPGSTVISYQDIYPRNYFMPYSVTNPDGYQEWQRAEREHGLLKRAVEYIAQEVPEELDIDHDNDGYVDNVVFNVKGGTTAWSTLLWPHRWVLYTEYVYIHGKRVWDYNFQLEEHMNSNGNGVLCHEMFHTLSAPDLYHYNSAPYVSVGPWDIMDNNANPPQSMGAYMKYRYGGWIEDIPEITECGIYTLNPISSPENNSLKIASPNSNYEYFVLEYRVKEGTFESSVPGTGLLVYRINSLYDGEGNAQGPPDEVYVYRPGGTNSTNGNLFAAHFAENYNRTEINDNTDPSSFLTNGQPGGLDISNVGIVGETISFEVNFEKEPVAEFESSDILITAGCSIDFTDLSTCYVDSWEWTFDGGMPATSTDQHPQGIVYQSSGFYSVTLTVTNAFGENTITKSNYIEVSTSALPEVEFFASDSAICTGYTVMLTDYSSVCPESWDWQISPSTFEFVNGTNANSQNTEVQFYEAGSYSVSLTVTNANGSSTLEKEDYIYAGGAALPFYEDFESGNAEQKGWTVVNEPEDNITWEMYTVSGNEGSKAVGINLFSYFNLLNRDQLISPPINLSGANNAVLRFDHAYALKDNPDYSDSLIVKISNDCGNTWTRILELSDDGSGTFATHAPTSLNFVPTVAEDWCGSGYGSECLEVNISQWAGQSNVMILFESVRLLGNNLFIDNVAVDFQTDTEEQVTESSQRFNIYPNPSAGVFTIAMKDMNPDTRVHVYNTQGQIIYTDILNQHATVKTINLSKEPNGLYFVHLISNDYQEVIKVVVE